MRTKTIGFVISALFASVAPGQTTAQPNLDRVFYFAHTETRQNMQEIATMIRTIADIRQMKVDEAQRSLTLQGTGDQIALAGWLFSQLDQPASGQPTPATLEYRLPGSGENVVRLLYLTHNQTVQEFQEIATSARTITNMRRVFTYNAQRAMALRGTADQVALAVWLFNELDKPASGQPPAQPATQPVTQPNRDSITHEFRVSNSSDDLVRVFYLAHSGTVQDFQKTAVQIRTTTKIRQVFTYNALRALAVRGTLDQISRAEQLVKELDNPISSNAR
jgi:hypothetical protein